MMRSFALYKVFRLDKLFHSISTLKIKSFNFFNRLFYSFLYKSLMAMYLKKPSKYDIIYLKRGGRVEKTFSRNF